MFAQLNLYAIIGLIIVVLALSSGWYLSNRIKSAEIDTLTQQHATLTSAIETNERTIAQMIADAQTLAFANQKLSHRIMATEMGTSG
jgi:outer membrane murein-binding lipoprotein Lpp